MLVPTFLSLLLTALRLTVRLTSESCRNRPCA